MNFNDTALLRSNGIDAYLCALRTISSYGTACVDSTDNSGINLSYDYYQSRSDLFSATQERDVLGVASTSEKLIGEIPHVQLGNFSVENQRIDDQKAESHSRRSFGRRFSSPLPSDLRAR